MSPTARARLALTRLDDRVVPSTVTATSAARPFEFVASGTLTTTDTSAAGGTSLTDTSTSAVNMSGTIAYSGISTGATGGLTVSGTGTGSQTATDGADGGRGSYAQAVQGGWAFADANGAVTSTTNLSGTRTILVPGGANIPLTLGPANATGTFDVSTFKLQTAWDDADSSGTLSATLRDKTNRATDLSFETSSAASRAADGTVTLDFSAVVTGNMIKAPSRSAAVTRVTAVWVGDGRTQSVDLNLPVYWNTGRITAHVTGLNPPAWADKLTVQLDAGETLTEGDESNNTLSIDLANLSPSTPTPTPTSPPPTTPGTAVPPVATQPGTPPSQFPRIPSDAPRRPTRFTVTPGATPVVNWIDVEGRVIGSSPAFDDFRGTVGLAAGDVNNDGIVDAVVSAGDGGGPRVRVLDGKTGAVLQDFFAYDPEFRGGVNVAVSDLNGDGYSDVVAAAGAGGGPHVRTFDGRTGQLTGEFFAFDPVFRGGMSVTTADLDRDGVAEIIVGAGAGGGPVFKALDARTGAERFAAFAAPDDFRDGVNVSATSNGGTVIVTADPNGDGPAKLFRNQMAFAGPLLEEIYQPAGVYVR